MLMTRFCMIFFMFIVCCKLPADRFSQFAEAHNVLDYKELAWSIRPCPVTLKLFGYVKAEAIFDTRQNFELRSGHLLYFPLDKLPDVRGEDINARGDFEEFAIQSRLDLSGEGPEVFCLNSDFLIEADFFGRSDDTIDGFDLRFAYLELKSDTFEFQAGQNFHPICFPFESPDTISFNSGIPIAPFALCPQFKIIYRYHNLELLGAAIGFLGDRPFGLAGGTDKVFRDSMMPDFFLQIRVHDEEINYVGLGFDINRLVPRLETNLGYKEVSPVTCVSTDLFARFQYEDFVFYTKLMYAQDGGIFELLGGIAVHTVDPLTDRRTYSPLQTIAWYAEFIRQGAFEPALFIGVVKNLGATTPIIPQLESEVTIYGIGTNIDTVFRVSPRIRWYINSFIVGVEYEFTRAAYGTINNHGKVIDAVPVNNNRFLFATYYIF